MNCDHLDAIRLVQELSYALEPDDYTEAEVSIHPPFTSLRALQTLLEVDRIPIKLGAQNCHFEDHGAFTGEISPGMLSALSVKYVIVGHSERRQLLRETDQDVAAKLRAVLRWEMKPILAVGETAQEKLDSQTESKIASQLTVALEGLKPQECEALVVAYEPIWAIGTGNSATAKDAGEVCAFIRSHISQMFTAKVAEKVRIQYGGSVKPATIADLMSQESIDGVLVGGASLQSEDFARIVRYRHEG